MSLLPLDIIYISLIGVSFAAGLMLTKKSSLLSYKLFLGFLGITFINELTCFFLKGSGVSTYPLYNIYYYFRFPFLGLVFQQLFAGKKRQVLFINAFYILSIILLGYNLYLYGGIKKLHTIYVLTGGIFILILCLMHFYNILDKEKTGNPLQFLFFWIATGFFFFFLSVLPFIGVLNFLAKKFSVFSAQQLVLVKALCLLLYSFVIIDYYLQWKKMKSPY
jgi:hypothetical protein